MDETNQHLKDRAENAAYDDTFKGLFHENDGQSGSAIKRYIHRLLEEREEDPSDKNLGDWIHDRLKTPDWHHAAAADLIDSGVDSLVGESDKDRGYSFPPDISEREKIRQMADVIHKRINGNRPHYIPKPVIEESMRRLASTMNSEVAKEFPHYGVVDQVLGNGKEDNPFQMNELKKHIPNSGWLHSDFHPFSIGTMRPELQLQGKRYTSDEAANKLKMPHDTAVNYLEDLAKQGFVRRHSPVGGSNFRYSYDVPDVDEIAHQLHTNGKFVQPTFDQKTQQRYATDNFINSIDREQLANKHPALAMASRKIHHGEKLSPHEELWLKSGVEKLHEENPHVPIDNILRSIKDWAEWNPRVKIPGEKKESPPELKSETPQESKPQEKPGLWGKIKGLFTGKKMERDGEVIRLAAVPDHEIHEDFKPTGIAPRIGHLLQRIAADKATSSNNSDLAEGIVKTGDIGLLPILADSLDETNHPLKEFVNWRHLPRGIAIDKALNHAISSVRLRYHNPDTGRHEIQPQSAGWTLADWRSGSTNQRLSRRRALSQIRQVVPDATPHDMWHSLLRLYERQDLIRRHNHRQELEQNGNPHGHSLPDVFRQPRPDEKAVTDGILGQLGVVPGSDPLAYPDTRKTRLSRDDSPIRLGLLDSPRSTTLTPEEVGSRVGSIELADHLNQLKENPELGSQTGYHLANAGLKNLGKAMDQPMSPMFESTPGEISHYTHPSGINAHIQMHDIDGTPHASITAFHGGKTLGHHVTDDMELAHGIAQEMTPMEKPMVGRLRRVRLAATLKEMLRPQAN